MRESDLDNKEYLLSMWFGHQYFTTVDIQQVVKYAIEDDIEDSVLEERCSTIVAPGKVLESHPHLIIEEAVGIALQAIAYRRLKEHFVKQKQADKRKEIEDKLQMISERRNDLKNRISQEKTCGGTWKYNDWKKTSQKIRLIKPKVYNKNTNCLKSGMILSKMRHAPQNLSTDKTYISLFRLIFTTTDRPPN